MTEDARAAERMNKLCERIDKSAAEWAKPVELRTPSGRWISARDARALVYSETDMHAGSNDAERALARRGHVIPTRVASWTYSWEPAEGMNRLDLAAEEMDMSDWTEAPYRIAYMRKLSVLSRIGDWVEPGFEESSLISACWESGDFTVVLDGDFRIETVSLVGLSFDEDALRESFCLPPVRKQYAGSLDGAGPEREQSKGGRPASRHGEVIAAATLRLAALSARELTNYTVDALASELEAEYRAIGENPPHDRNRQTYASGILSVLRSR